MRVAEEDRSGLGVGNHHVDLPLGAVITFAGDLGVAAVERRLISQGWLPCDGRLVSIASFRGLYQLLGRLYTPAGTAKDSFCLPDYRGQFLRGVTTDAKLDPGLKYRTPPPGGTAKASVGSTQPGMVQTHQHHYQALKGVEVGDAGSAGGVPPQTAVATTDLLDGDGAALTGEETRPRNIYVNFLIKAAHSTRGIGVVW